MNRIGAAFFIALLGVAFASGARTSRALAQNGGRTRQSSAFASSRASSGAVSGSDVERIVAKAFADARADDANADAITKTTATEVGTLFVKAWGEATAVVEVEGNGKAFAAATATAEATAQLFARALSGAVATAVSGTTFTGDKAEADEVAVAIVKATAEAAVEVETTGGFSEATSRVTSTAVADVVVTAIADAVAFVADGGVDVEAKVKSKIEVDVRKQTGDSTVELVGETDAEVTPVGSSAKADAVPVVSPGDAVTCASIACAKSTNKVADALPSCTGEASACCFFESFCESYTKVDARRVQNDKSGELCEC